MTKMLLIFAISLLSWLIAFFVDDWFKKNDEDNVLGWRFYFLFGAITLFILALIINLTDWM